MRGQRLPQAHRPQSPRCRGCARFGRGNSSNGTPSAPIPSQQEAAYYREHAERARRLARSVTKGDVEQQLLQMAEEYERLVVDREKGAIEIRKPEQLRQ
jgi:hypothetical protein